MDRRRIVHATLQAMNAIGPNGDSTLNELMHRPSVLGRFVDATLAKDPTAAESTAPTPPNVGTTTPYRKLLTGSFVLPAP
jgi:hypothetical protein